MLDLILVFEQLIERAVPLLQLSCLNPHPWGSAHLPFAVVTPSGYPLPAIAVADEVGLQPACQPMFARRCSKPIGNQHQRAITRPRAVTAARTHKPINRCLQAEFLPPVTCDQHRSPIKGCDRFHILAANADFVVYHAVAAGLAVPQLHHLVEVEMCRKQVTASEIEDGAMACLAFLTKGFDHAHVFVLDAFATGGADHAQEHGLLQHLSLPMET